MLEPEEARHACELCGNMEVVYSVETPDGWRMRDPGITGFAKTSRPEVVEFVWSRRHGSVRAGWARCPLCEPNLTKSETDEFLEVDW